MGGLGGLGGELGGLGGLDGELGGLGGLGGELGGSVKKLHVDVSLHNVEKEGDNIKSKREREREGVREERVRKRLVEGITVQLLEKNENIDLDSSDFFVGADNVF